MKKTWYNKIGMLFIGTTAGCILSLFWGFTNDDVVQRERPLVSSMSVTPTTPSQISFCGQTIDLKRYERHEALDRELTSFSYLHATTMLLIKRANRYFPIIEPILEANGIPDDFKYLAVIESNLDQRAVSPAKAAGFWQFMPQTAKQYGLTITTSVDERFHVEKATNAACRYLKDAYKKYNDWVSVAASYNAGMGRISGELEKQAAGSALDLWLVEETSRYVYRILAIKQIFENPYKYGFILESDDLYKPIRFQKVETKDIPDLSEFAKQHGITYADLKRFNPWLKERKLQSFGKIYTIDVPLKEDLYYEAGTVKVHNPAWVVK